VIKTWSPERGEIADCTAGVPERSSQARSATYAGLLARILVVQTPAEAPPRGRPRSDQDAELLKSFEARIRLPLIASAVLPLVIIPEPGEPVSVVVGVLTWLVFLADYVFHVRHLERYNSTGLGKFDLSIVLVTAPWYLLPGLSGGEFVVILRLARLARLFIATPAIGRLVNRLGKVAAIAGAVVLVASLVAYAAEHPTNSEFANVGDALWWGVVTLTTVGYGDIVPKTTTGRAMGVVIMFTGIAVLGVLSGSLASFFGLGSSDDDTEEPEDTTDQPATAGATPAPTTAPPLDALLVALTSQVSDLRAEVRALSDRLEAGGGRGPQPPEQDGG
jgi:voltage-gated potassium channel